MVLTDDNFATIVRAVEEGRAIYDNIVKFVRFQLSTNMGAIQTVLGASLLGWTTPFTAIQILWINIIMDGPPAMSLGVEPARAGVMDEPPRRTDAHILTLPRLGRLLTYGATMAVGTLALFHHARPQGEAYALTLAFTVFVLFQFFNLFNARAEHGSAFDRNFLRNGWLWTSLAAVAALQVLVVHWRAGTGGVQHHRPVAARLGPGRAGGLERVVARRGAQVRTTPAARKEAGMTRCARAGP